MDILLTPDYKIRVMLWATHPCEGKYGDDGELQCNCFLPVIDFRRDSPEEIEHNIRSHNEQRTQITMVAGVPDEDLILTDFHDDYDPHSEDHPHLSYYKGQMSGAGQQLAKVAPIYAARQAQAVEAERKRIGEWLARLPTWEWNDGMQSHTYSDERRCIPWQDIETLRTGKAVK